MLWQQVVHISSTVVPCHLFPEISQEKGLISRLLPIGYTARTKCGSSIVCRKNVFWYNVLVTFNCRNTWAVNTQYVTENSWHHEAEKYMWQWSILAVSIQTRKWQWQGFWQGHMWFHLSDRLTWVTSHEIPPISQKLQQNNSIFWERLQHITTCGECSTVLL